MAGGDATYDYFVDRVRSLSGSAGGKVLDFGCGKGTLMARALAAGVDIWGADTFTGIYHGWAGTSDGSVKSRIHRIVDGRLAFPDATFDVVIANQVFEHIAEPEAALAEISRVLKPGGSFLAFFPAGDVWFEGHVGLYFPHSLRTWPRVQWSYLYALRRLGFGYYGRDMSASEWSTHMQTTMRDEVWYHPWRDIQRWWVAAFGVRPTSMATDYMSYRAGRSPALAGLVKRFGSPWLAPLVSFVCHRRAGRLLLVSKPMSGAHS